MNNAEKQAIKAQLAALGAELSAASGLLSAAKSQANEMVVTPAGPKPVSALLSLPQAVEHQQKVLERLAKILDTLLTKL